MYSGYLSYWHFRRICCHQPTDWGGRFLWNSGAYLPVYMHYIRGG